MSAVVAFVQVERSVRRPVSADTFEAIEVRDDGRGLWMRGSWRGSAEVRNYTLPLRSIVAVRWLEEDAA